MKSRMAILLLAMACAGCASRPIGPAPMEDRSDRQVRLESASVPVSGTLEEYKHALALRIAQANSASVYSGRPQALLRSIVVVKYGIDAQGRLVHSALARSNNDIVTEALALSSLRDAAPFPKPAPQLLRHGRVDVSETWLFNDDGRFQLRTIAQPQMDE